MKRLTGGPKSRYSQWMANMVDFKALGQSVDSCCLPVSRGRVLAANEMTLEAELPGARVGMRVMVRRSSAPDNRFPAEVALCDGSLATLLPLAEMIGVGPGDAVTTVGSSIKAGAVSSAAAGSLDSPSPQAWEGEKIAAHIIIIDRARPVMLRMFR